MKKIIFLTLGILFIAHTGYAQEEPEKIINHEYSAQM